MANETEANLEAVMQGPAKIIPNFEDQPESGSNMSKQAESISAYLEELHTPAFVQPQKAPNKPKATQINLKSPQNTKGSARFVLSLNNRVVKMDRRLHKLETHVEHLVNNQIGIRHLIIGTGFVALMFATLFLGLQHFQTGKLANDPIEQSLLEAINQTEDKRQRKAALALLAELSSNNTIQTWANTQLESATLDTRNHYRWPLEKQQFSPTGVEYEPYKRGINIPAKLGDPVVAIKPGTVVYSGQGIAGYGNLILIQHEDDLISVYGNNYSNYAKEGMNVKQGQLIAAVGEGSGKRAALYFEIRHKGEPEDPFLYFNQ